MYHLLTGPPPDVTCDHAQRRRFPLRDAAAPRRRGGWKDLRKGTLLLTARKLLQRVPAEPVDFNCLYFFEYLGLPPGDGSSSMRHSEIEIREASTQDLDGMEACQDTREAYLRRFRANDHCVVAVDRGRIVGFQWFCVQPCHLEERYSYPIEIPPDTIYTYDAYILPEYRLTGIWMRFHTIYLSPLMQELRKKRVLAMVDRGNRVSINTHLRFGYQPFRKVFVARLFGKSLHLSRPILPGPAGVLAADQHGTGRAA